MNSGLVGALTPSGDVFVTCGGEQTFTCIASRIDLRWTISGLYGINIDGPFRPYKISNSRIETTDKGETTQEGISSITILGFNESDREGIIKCVNKANTAMFGSATIKMGECVCTMEVLN